MTVFSWQIGIFLFVSLAGTVFGRVALFVATGIAAIWTFANIYAEWLMALQFMTIFLAFFLSRKLLLHLGQEYYEGGLMAFFARKETADLKDSESLKPIHGREHLELLANALETSKFRLVIVSGFISPKVIEYKFTNALKRALARGVQVVLIFGGSSSGNIGYKRDAETAVRRLIAAENQVAAIGKKTDLKIIDGDIHDKILIKDSDIIAHGSFNWLSNSSVQSSESSTVSRDADYINQFYEDLKHQYGF